MAEPTPTEVAPWYLRNITQALELDSVTGQVHVRSSIVGGNVTIAGNIIVSNVTVDAIGNIDVSGPTMPVSGNINIDAGNVTVLQGTDPWMVEGNVNANVSGNVNIDNTVQVTQGTDPWMVDGNIAITNSPQVAFNPALTDAFGRLRVSNPVTLFDTQTRYYDHQQFASLVEGSANVQYNANSSSFTMNLSSNPGDNIIRETYKVFPYQPGKSLLTMNTFCMNPEKTNLRQRVGFFGADNGVYFEVDDTTYNMVIRSKSTGVVVEDRIPQSSWNGDRLDGNGGATNPSGIDLDPSLVQIFWTDIEWLGVGSVRVGFVINGNFILCHTFNHANTPSTLTADNTTTYMTTACLPIRYEITNTGGTTGSSSLRQVCSTVISEGGYNISGMPRSAGHTLAAPITLPNDSSFKPLISIRLQPTRLDAVVTPTFYSIIPKGQSNFKFRVYSRAITTGGSWVNVDGTFESSVQYNLSPTSVTSGFVAAESFIVTSNQSSGAPAQVSNGFSVQLARDSFTGTAYEYVLAAATTGTNQDVYASIEWQEAS